MKCTSRTKETRNLSPLLSLWLVLAVYVLTSAFFLIAVTAEPPPSGVPSAQKSRVREIKIELREIFDEPNIGLFYRLVNSAKVSTREEVIRREVLFKEGDEFDPFLVQESERNLRSLPYLRKISITPIRDGDQVDLIVSVQDTWTLYPFFSLSSGGGTNKSAVGLTEGNLLGYGKRLEALVAEDEGRQKVEVVWDDRRFLGTQQRLTLGHFERSDGSRSVASYGRPFRSLVDKSGWFVDGDSFDLVGRLFEDAEERFIFRQEHHAVQGGYTIASGDPEVLVHRYTLGYGYLNDIFDPADADDFEDADVDPDSVSQDITLVPEDRRFSGPVVSYQRIEPDFLSINFVDRFDRVEDLNLGNEFVVNLQAAPKSFGSLDDTFIFRTSDADGWRLTPTSFVRGQLAFQGRANSEGFNDTILSTIFKYYNVLGAQYLGDAYVGKHTLASSLVVDIGEDLDQDFEFSLGAGTGLRGYKDRTFTGDHRLVVNLEDRFHLVEDVFRLVSVGGAVFFDAGGTSRSSMGEIIRNNFYSNVGFGLRFAMTRSSGGTVVRVDVAFPLRDGPDGSGEFEPRILFTTGQLFGAGLRSDSSGLQTPSVSAGFVGQ